MIRKEAPGATGGKSTQRSEHGGASSRDGAPKSNARGDVLRARGWQEVKEGEGEWDFYWCDVAWMREHFDQIYLEEHQRVCHFRNHYELTRYVVTKVHA